MRITISALLTALVILIILAIFTSLGAYNPKPFIKMLGEQRFLCITETKVERCVKLNRYNPGGSI